MSFVVLDTERPLLIEHAKKHGYKCYWVKFNHRRRKSGMLRSFLRLFFLFMKIKPDVVHSHLFDDAVPALFAAKLAGVKKRILTKQDTAFHFNYAPKWVKFDRFNNRNATHVVPVSSEAFDFVKDVEKCPQSKMNLVHHGIDANQFLHPDMNEVSRIRKLYVSDEQFLVGTLARFIDWKKYHHIVEVAEKCIKINDRIVFVFWGNGEMKPEIRRLILEKGLEKNVIIADLYPRDKIQNVYYAMDAYLHAAYMEPFGFVIAEAMMCGLPVVSTPTGAALDAIEHKHNGWLGEYNNPDSLLKGVLWAYEQHFPKPWNLPLDKALTIYDFDRMFQAYSSLHKC